MPLVRRNNRVILVGSVSLLLDKVGSAAAAFGLRKLRAAYAGKAVNIRRSSDNTTQDIGFIATGDFDATSFSSFIGAGSGFVTKWYDQSGNANDVSQATAANQPQLLLTQQNGHPALSFTAGQWLESTTGAATGNAAHTIITASALGSFATGTQYAVAAYSGFAAAGENSAIGMTFDNTNTTEGTWFGGFSENGGSGPGTGTGWNGSTNPGTAAHVLSKTYSSGTVTGFIDQATDLTHASITYNLGDTHLLIGVQNSGGSNAPFHGKIFETLFWPSALSGTNRTTAEANIKTYWGTP